MNKKYIHQIVKRLQCSGKKRKEIKKQLTADFMAELENGAKESDIMEQLGTPSELADEFNSTFSADEKKKCRREKGIKVISIIMAGILLLATAVYWVLPKSKPMEESKLFKKEEMKAETERIITLLEQEEYSELKECSIEKMKDFMNKETMDEIKEKISMDWGELQSYGTFYMAEVTQMGQHYATVQVTVTYDNVSVTYTITFDEALKLAGLWMK